MKYYGEKRHSTWAKYTAKHKELRVTAILAEQGYSNFTEREKVTYLVDGVETNDRTRSHMRIQDANDLSNVNWLDISLLFSEYDILYARSGK